MTLQLWRPHTKVRALDPLSNHKKAHTANGPLSSPAFAAVATILASILCVILGIFALALHAVSTLIVAGALFLAALSAFQ